MVTGMLKVFDFDVYAFLHLGSTLSYMVLS